MLMDLEPQIVARLAALPGLLGVYGAGDYADLAKAGKPSPCAYVLHGGYRVAGGSDDGEDALVEETWLVILSLKHAGRSAGADPVRARAAPEIDAVVRAMMGWRPQGRSYKAFRLAPAPRAEPLPSRLLFPLAFTVEHTISNPAPA